MAVTFNEAALHNLLGAEQGPVMREVERKANLAAEALQGRIDEIMWRAFPSDRPKADVLMTVEGAVIGINPVGNSDSIASYIADKLGPSRENWWLDVGREAARGPS